MKRMKIIFANTAKGHLSYPWWECIENSSLKVIKSADNKREFIARNNLINVHKVTQGIYSNKKTTYYEAEIEVASDIDMIFIDAKHSFKGVRSLWEE